VVQDKHEHIPPQACGRAFWWFDLGAIFTRKLIKPRMKHRWTQIKTMFVAQLIWVSSVADNVLAEVRKRIGRLDKNSQPLRG